MNIKACGLKQVTFDLQGVLQVSAMLTFWIRETFLKFTSPKLSDQFVPSISSL